MPMANQTQTIRYQGIEFPAVRCERCGTLIYPARDLRMHQALHELKDTRLHLTKAQNRRTFTTMRNW
jgi:uncharacterized OB-fold protein